MGLEDVWESTAPPPPPQIVRTPIRLGPAPSLAIASGNPAVQLFPDWGQPNHLRYSAANPSGSSGPSQLP